MAGPNTQHFLIFCPASGPLIDARCWFSQRWPGHWEQGPSPTDTGFCPHRGRSAFHTFHHLFSTMLERRCQHKGPRMPESRVFCPPDSPARGPTCDCVTPGLSTSRSFIEWLWYGYQAADGLEEVGRIWGHDKGHRGVLGKASSWILVFSLLTLWFETLAWVSGSPT